jgi:hydroxymethylpyrimidine pyrophosphatase-like HAD family hydrolase
MEPAAMKLGDRFLFVSDLDGTLLPNTGALPDLGCLERTGELLCALHEAGCPLCYVTEDHLFRAQQAAKIFRLPLPTWWMCNLGTEIYDRRGKPDPEWQWRLGPLLDQAGLLRVLRDIPGLVAREGLKQGSRKLSFQFPGPISEELRHDIMECLGDARGGLQLVAGTDPVTGRGLVDVIPANAGTARAIRYLAEGYFLPLSRVFFAGDSSDDLDVLLSGVNGTLVGNAGPEVRKEVRRFEAGRESVRLYEAEGYYGDGVIEGLRHYGLWPLCG